MPKKIQGLFLIALSVVTVARAHAQAVTTTEKPVYLTPDHLERAKDRPDGWSYAMTLAANLNLASNRDVVGQLEGNSVLFGGSALAGATYLRARHQLVNTGSFTGGWSKTPALDRVVKSTDLLELQMLYNFFLNAWTGPFARIGAQTSLVKTERLTAGPVDYVREDAPAGTPATTTSRLRLSDALQPFTLSESAGWFAQPVRSEPLNLVGRAGFGGRHTFAGGTRAITDDDEAVVVYSELDDVHQAGAELFTGLDGKQLDGKLIYTVGVTALFPFLNNDDGDRSILELTRVSLAGALGMGVLSWLSINYQLKVMRDPQLVDAVQVQNALLFSLQYTYSSYTAPKPEPPLSPAAQARIAELEARVATAEQRARAAEQTARALGVEPPAPIEPPAEPPPSGPDPRMPVPNP